MSQDWISQKKCINYGIDLLIRENSITKSFGPQDSYFPAFTIMQVNTWRTLDDDRCTTELKNSVRFFDSRMVRDSGTKPTKLSPNATIATFKSSRCTFKNHNKIVALSAISSSIADWISGMQITVYHLPCWFEVFGAQFLWSLDAETVITLWTDGGMVVSRDDKCEWIAVFENKCLCYPDLIGAVMYTLNGTLADKILLLRPQYKPMLQGMLHLFKQVCKIGSCKSFCKDQVPPGISQNWHMDMVIYS